VVTRGPCPFCHWIGEPLFCACVGELSTALTKIMRRLDESGCGLPDPSTEWHIANEALEAHNARIRTLQEKVRWERKP
jgi:hypothetical protein